jgi:hypothetical protein
MLHTAGEAAAGGVPASFAGLVGLLSLQADNQIAHNPQASA